MLPINTQLKRTRSSSSSPDGSVPDPHRRRVGDASGSVHRTSAQGPQASGRVSPSHPSATRAPRQASPFAGAASHASSPVPLPAGVAVVGEADVGAAVAALRHGVDHASNPSNVRINAAKDMLAACDDGFPADAYTTLSHQLQGRPAGLLALQHPNKVHVMLSHPDSYGVGSALVTGAVNVAAQRTGSPVLHLEAMDADAVRAYEKMGFTVDMDDGGEHLSAHEDESDSDSDDQMVLMTLDAAHSDKWRHDAVAGWVPTQPRTPAWND